MKTYQRIIALLLICLLTVSLAACNKDDDDTPLTTKSKKTTTTTAPTIDIWSYINNSDSEGGSGLEEPGTIGSDLGSSGLSGSSGLGGSGSMYEDMNINFGGSNIFSSSTTSKSGYPTFSWNPVSGAVRYNIYRSTSKNGTYHYLDSTTATSYTDRTAISGQQYYYQVKAVKKAATTAAGGSSANKTTAAAVTTTRNTANAPATAPQSYYTINQILDFYNTSANNAKAKAKSVTRVFRTIKYIDDEDNSETLKTGLALAGLYENTDNKAKTFNTPDTIKKEFPAGGSSVSSTLTSRMVSSATCTYKNGYYNVTINLKNDPSRTVDYSKTCVNVINASAYYSGAVSETRGVKIQAKIYYDGTLDYLDQYVPTWIFATYNGNDANVNLQAALSIEEYWAISY